LTKLEKMKAALPDCGEGGFLMLDLMEETAVRERS
jgi:hypothetical protein